MADHFHTFGAAEHAAVARNENAIHARVLHFQQDARYVRRIARAELRILRYSVLFPTLALPKGR
jgi:hypothetical protein